MGDYEDSPQELVGTGYNAQKMLRKRTVPEQLRDKKAHLEEQLKNVTAAIEALEKNPEIENLLHLLSKAGY